MLELHILNTRQFMIDNLRLLLEDIFRSIYIGIHHRILTPDNLTELKDFILTLEHLSNKIKTEFFDFISTTLHSIINPLR